jgi:predicted nucleotidyltransferase component of viral defense system
MIDRAEILAVAGDLSLTPDVIEKDYVLGWLLAGIYGHHALARAWIFKGGTCLKKCYFETYRFSEDLDFTISDQSHLNAEFLTSAFREVATWIYDETGIEIPADHLRFEVLRNPRGGVSCEGRVYYNGPLQRAGSLPRIKLDLTADEVLVLDPVERPVGHPYSDVPDGGIIARCYAYEELLAEKVRALAERTRPRDLYDVINLFRYGEFRPAVSAVVHVLKRKCAFKGIPFPTLAGLAGTVQELTADWRAMLSLQLPALPPFESFWNALPEFFSWLESGAAPTLVPAPAPAGEQVLRPAVGYLRRQGVPGSSFLETIRFAGANRLCVELDYVNEQGQRSVRTIVPYSLRRTAADEIVVRAVRVDDDEPRSYRLDRIRGARVTDRTFVPRYEVELSARELGAIPPVSSGSAARGFALPARPRRTTSRPLRATLPRTGPTYVYECPYCRKKFRRSTQDSRLGPHKTPDGWPCSGRTGYLVDAKYH